MDLGGTGLLTDEHGKTRSSVGVALSRELGWIRSERAEPRPLELQPVSSRWDGHVKASFLPLCSLPALGAEWSYLAIGLEEYLQRRQ